MSSITQPAWTAPTITSEAVRKNLPDLTIYNSLTKSKTPFVPIDQEGKQVDWYACGPTVYDDAHLGHARNYVSTDVIRRILQDYFKFKVRFVMNITDVDDKIILAARQQHLLSEWLAKHETVDNEVRGTTEKAFEAYIRKNLSLLEEGVTAESYKENAALKYGHVLDGKSLANDGSPPGDQEAKIKMHLKTAQSASEAISDPASDITTFSKNASGVLLPYIDSLHSTSVTGKDHDIFTKLTKRYEERFFQDMKALNVLPPDELTRVTEYGPPIVDFVKQIQDNGFAYEHEGSVYYDVGSWEAAGGVYARLEPWNRNDTALQADGEGALAAKKTAFKKSAADFVLWKASKPGEPSWPSPWGEGRPGWHIECSAMASKILGKTFDIHSGGIDLAFPHHDNELAQSEAYWCTPDHIDKHAQWVNYFIHMGHLSIQGSKMSKSLKNFTTIREALATGEYTSRSMRIVFLMGAWKDGLEITKETVRTGVAWEEKADNFFLKVQDLQQNKDTITNGNGITESTTKLQTALADAQKEFRDAMCDSFDTLTAMRAISKLLTEYNTEKQVDTATTLNIGEWVTEMVVMLGLDSAYVPGTIGWSGLTISESAKKFITLPAEIRDQIREQAKTGTVDGSNLSTLPETKASTAEEERHAEIYNKFRSTVSELSAKNAPVKEWLAATDDFRNNDMPSVDLYLEDRDGQPALVRPLSTSLRQEIKDREALAKQKADAKQKAKIAAEAAEKERLEKGKLSHLEMYRTSEYSAWDADGLPTKDAEGVEVAKSKGKKLKKDWDRQKKLHEAYLASQK